MEFGTIYWPFVKKSFLLISAKRSSQQRLDCLLLYSPVLDRGVHVSKDLYAVLKMMGWSSGDYGRKMDAMLEVYNGYAALQGYKESCVD